MSVTIRTLHKRKQDGEKFSVLTAYDACFSRLISEAGVDAILVGGSLGNVIQGQSSTVPVTLEQMAYHTECVARGNQGSLIIADVPFMGAATLERALETATALMQAGANMVKLEGSAWLAESRWRPTGRANSNWPPTWSATSQLASWPTAPNSQHEAK